MRVNSLFFIVLISVIGSCLGYKLRRDIGKIRYYCKEVCTQCGGEPAMSRDVCVCNIEEAEGEEVKRCLDRARNKFEFLGIKLETEKKTSGYPANSNRQGDDSHVEQEQEKRPLFKRLFSGISQQNGDEHEEKKSSDEVAAKADDNPRPKRSFDNYGRGFDLTSLSDIFQPVDNYPIRPKTNFKILVGESNNPKLNRRTYYSTKASGRVDDNDCSEDESDSNESNDYADSQVALGDELDLRRLGNEETNMYELIPPPDHSQLDESTINEFHSIWDSVLSELLNQDYYIPPNFADNILFV